ncbi:MAG: VWA domain-containing protein [Trueperaceae bacterium]|nr:MAG: VWA domain-containing protein [Trueperaceae bacterium]
MVPFELTFDFPWAFLALPLLFLLPRKKGWLARIFAITLLVTALAQPSLGRPGTEIAVLIDVSKSVGQNGIVAAQQFDFSKLPEAPEFFYFAGDTTQVTRRGATIPPFLDTSVTDISRALQVASASGVQRALLISDGAESLGNSRLALPDIPIDSFEVSGQANVRLTSLLAPEQTSRGATVEVIAVIESDLPTSLTLYSAVGDTLLEPITREISAGKTSVPFTFQVEQEKTIQVTSSIVAGFPQPQEDDRLDIEIAVSAREPVLIIGDSAMATLLRSQGFEVQLGTVGDITSPLPYSAIILRETAGQFTPGQLDLLKRYVENGGGLMMTGGPSSFGFGAWYRTPVEEVLPVNTDLRTEVELPLVALIIVMDRSQSMSTGNPSKIELAKEGAISVVDLAYQDDLLGLIAFSDQSSTEWVFGLRKATERGKREMLNAILNIGTQGGTVLFPAYEMAIESLRETEASVKHIIILSDGKLYDGQGPFSSTQDVDFDLLALRGLGEKITTSTIAIGQNADFERLEAIAFAGGGRYYQALDINTLPQIFTSEALTATRSLLREELIFPIVRQHPLSAVEGRAPPLDAYIASTLKADAETILEGLQNEPILAVRRQGLGRTSALTTDLNTWAGTFGEWEQLPALLGTVTRWLQARPATFSAVVTREGNLLRVVVDAVENGTYINNKTLVARYNGIDRELEQVAPGRYEGRLEAPSSGGSLIVYDGSEVVARSRVSTPNPEFNTQGASERLREISTFSGGKNLDIPGVYAPPTPSTALPVWAPIALAGLLIFLLELVFRRLEFLGMAPLVRRRN